MIIPVVSDMALAEITIPVRKLKKKHGKHEQFQRKHNLYLQTSAQRISISSIFVLCWFAEYVWFWKTCPNKKSLSQSPKSTLQYQQQLEMIRAGYLIAAPLIAAPHVLVIHKYNVQFSQHCYTQLWYTGLGKQNTESLKVDTNRIALIQTIQLDFVAKRLGTTCQVNIRRTNFIQGWINKVHWKESRIDLVF